MPWLPDLNGRVIRSDGWESEPEPTALLQLVDVDGLGQTFQVVEFRHDIRWLRTSTTTWRAFSAGEPLKQGSRRNDFYGYLTSKSEILEEAQAFARRHGCGPDSAIKVEVELSVEETPVVAFPAWFARQRGPQQYGRSLWLTTGREWMLDDERSRAWAQACAERGSTNPGDIPPPTTLASRSLSWVIWSSAVAGDQTALLEEIRAKARAPGRLQP